MRSVGGPYAVPRSWTRRRLILPLAVRTKNAKTMTTWFFPVGEDIEAIFSEWLHFLRIELLWGSDDPLFPASKIVVGNSGHFENCGVDRKHWKSAAANRRVSNRDQVSRVASLAMKQVCGLPRLLAASRRPPIRTMVEVGVSV
jgi:hypothetical protein